MRNPIYRLRDILEAIAAIEKYLPSDKQVFEREDLLQVWVFRQLQIIGEAAKAIPEDIRGQAPNIQWQEIAGMRDVLVHSYFKIVSEVVWDTANQDIPLLKPEIERLLARLESSE
ncbi:MAG: DUF86 domain-containing protein [Acidobacteriaceae bacterium]|nr:DUF86 domain-containing protein [Acidobacteriaceae bacterium]